MEKMEKDKEQMDQKKDQNTRKRKGEERFTIVCIGDSIVEGYPYGEQDSWVNCARRIRKDAVWINCGVSGETTGQIRWRVKADGLLQETAGLQGETGGLRPQTRWIVLSCGTNDFIFLEGDRGTAASAFDNIAAMVSEARQRDIGVMVTAPPMTIPAMASRRWVDGTDYDQVNRKLEELRLRLHRWCDKQDENVIFLDLWEQYCRWCAEEGEIAYYVDGIHPTRKGYEKIAAFVCEKLPHMNSRLENTIEGEEAMR